jgi:uncharacterized protein YkwD
MISRYVSVVLLMAVLAVVTAGGASAAEPDETGAASTATVRSCTGGSINLSAGEKEMLDLHNRTRAARGLPRFCIHPALQRAARAHSKEMIDKDYFRHNSANGERFWVRLKRFGYNWRTAGENILYDPGAPDTPNSLFTVWMNSSGHRANILNRSFREIGIGAYAGNYKGGSATMWAADFGDR